MELHFSDEPEGLSYTTVGGGLLSVSGGAVTGARRLTQGSNQGWAVSVAPAGDGDVVMSLPARACGKTHAVCFAGRALAEAVSATVTKAPFTASFSGVPPEHDGATPFVMAFRLSEEPDGLSYVTVRDALFVVTGGSIAGVSRLEQGSDAGWRLRVAPAGLGDVRFQVLATTACDTAPGVCTADGRMLAAGAEALIAGPAVLSVDDAQVEEASGAALDFVVTLSRQRSTATTVDYATSNGTGTGAATAGVDYTTASGTLTFAAGETTRTVSVAVLDDGHDEGEETLTLTLSNPQGARLDDATAVGTITNNDPMPKAWMARFGRTVGSQVVEAVSSRLDGRPAASRFTVGGVSLGAGTARDAAVLAPQDRLAAHLAQEPDAQRPAERSLTGRDLLLGSSFHLVSQPEASGGAVLSAWGRLSTGGFRAALDGVTLDGDVTTGLLGFDAEWERLLAGLLLARSDGNGAYALDDGGERGSLESTITGVYPYARLRLSHRVSAWGVAGVGSGDLRLRLANEAIDTGLGLRLGAIGVKGMLLEGAALALSVKSDALWVRTESDAALGLAGAAAQVSRLRVILEAERAFMLSAGAVLTPTLQVGVRHDGGDAERGTGVEVGAGFRYRSGLLTLGGQVRTLLAHASGDYEEWGASGALRLSPDASGLGASLAVLPSWGASASGVARLWSSPDASAPSSPGAAPSPGGRLDAELGYGLRALRGRGVLTPYARMGLVESESRSWHLGARLALAESLTLSLEGSRRRAKAPPVPTTWRCAPRCCGKGRRGVVP